MPGPNPNQNLIFLPLRSFAAWQITSRKRPCSHHEQTVVHEGTLSSLVVAGMRM